MSRHWFDVTKAVWAEGIRIACTPGMDYKLKQPKVDWTIFTPIEPVPLVLSWGEFDQDEWADKTRHQMHRSLQSHRPEYEALLTWYRERYNW